MNSALLVHVGSKNSWRLFKPMEATVTTMKNFGVTYLATIGKKIQRALRVTGHITKII